MPQLIIKSKGLDHSCMYDQRDHQLISQYKWSLHSKGYAVAYAGKRQILMHRLILGIVDRPEIECDHQFHNRLDNRRSKIRVCTHSQNRRNARKLKPMAHSQYKGIYNDLGRWHCQIMQDGRVKNLGRFSNEISGAKRYDSKALEIFGAFAFLNFQSSREASQLTFPWIQ